MAEPRHRAGPGWKTVWVPPVELTLDNVRRVELDLPIAPEIHHSHICDDCGRRWHGYNPNCQEHKHSRPSICHVCRVRQFGAIIGG